MASHCRALSRQEEEADQISYECMQAIRRSFITPFDRSDIKALSVALDDAIDQMNKTAKTVMLYDVTKFTPNMKAMADAFERRFRRQTIDRIQTTGLPKVCRNPPPSPLATSGSWAARVPAG